MKKILQISIVVTGLFLSSLDANAAAYNCGRTVRALTGGKYGPEYNLALNWARLPRTNVTVGAVVVQTRKGRNSAGGPGGHVALIRQILSPCKAKVEDDKGLYIRNICKNLVAYVMP